MRFSKEPRSRIPIGILISKLLPFSKLDSEKDPRSHDMRSKLLSLHLVLAILQSHSDVFADPTVVVPSSSSSEDTPFLLATKQYLCLGISRNALSSVNQVFDLSTEIFWCMLKSLRAQLKVNNRVGNSFLSMPLY